MSDDEATAEDEEGMAEDEGDEGDDRAALREELDHLKVDLALKDSYAMELSARLAERDHEVGTLGHALGQARDRVAKQDAELARLRAAVVQLQVQLDEITGRAGYRLLARASTWLDRHHRVRRAATGVARRLSGR